MCLNSREGGLAVKRIEGSKTNASLNTLSAGETTSSTWDTWELKRLSSDVWRRKIGIGACVSQHSYRKLFQNWAIVWKTQENFAAGKKLLFPLLSKVLWRNNWKWGLSLQGLEIPRSSGGNRWGSCGCDNRCDRPLSPPTATGNV